ncbi:MAG TPA: class I adenylate-forming enzyme family protein [Acidimicrobiales bacterium]|nr:class I adenylate-forming enzyme family protein [Acidimicrobiales bacterium]
MDLLIGDVFRTGARSVPDRVAAAMGERRITYRELGQQSNRVAHVLRDLGVGHRDRVVMWSNTTLDAIPVFAATAKLGAVFAPANALLGIDEAVEMVALARPSLLIVDGAHAESGEIVAQKLGVPLVCMHPGAGVGISLPEAAAAAPDDDVREPALRETDLHVLFFTSGSTGKSKGVMLSHRTNYLRTHPGSQLEPRGVMLCMYPLFHMGAWTLALQAWQTQTAIVFSSADAASLVAAAAEWKPTHFNAIPAVWRRVLDHLEQAGDYSPLSTLRIADSGTSATPPELLSAIKRAVPQATLRVFYGATESGAVTLLRHEDMERKPGSCGVPQHSVEVAIADDTGEMLVRSAVIFDGYFDNPEATAAAFTDDRFFRTGDLAALDDEGFLSIVGRAKDVIRTGGETVSPSEVEDAVRLHPAIADVAVVGIPDAQWGEIVCAVVVVKDGAEAPTVATLGEFTAATLARFKRPRRVEVVDVLPRTPATLQVQRRLLIERLTGG